MGVELFMLSNQLLHPYHVVPAVEFATAEVEMCYTLVAHTLMEANTLMGEVFILVFDVGNAGIHVEDALGF